VWGGCGVRKTGESRERFIRTVYVASNGVLYN
jgi:hypothetical protein